MTKTLTVKNKKDKKFLGQKVEEFDFGTMTKDEIRKEIAEMREVMRESEGVGLAANQIGKNIRLFIAEFDGKFYAIFNPEIIKASKESEVAPEGCLSVPEEVIEVKRPTQITLKGFDKNSKRVKLKAWGHLARIFQHEVDHLNGKLITDYK